MRFHLEPVDAETLMETVHEEPTNHAITEQHRTQSQSGESHPGVREKGTPRHAAAASGKFGRFEIAGSHAGNLNEPDIV